MGYLCTRKAQYAPGRRNMHHGAQGRLCFLKNACWALANRPTASLFIFNMTQNSFWDRLSTDDHSFCSRKQLWFKATSYGLTYWLNGVPEVTEASIPPLATLSHCSRQFKQNMSGGSVKSEVVKPMSKPSQMVSRRQLPTQTVSRQQSPQVIWMGLGQAIFHKKSFIL